MIFIAIAIAIVCVEAVIKGNIERKESSFSEKKLRGFLHIRKYHNNGAFLNLLEKRRGFVKWISVLYCVLLTVLFVVTLGKMGNELLKTGLALLLGGAYSNTYDRLRRKYVVDYFSIHIPGKFFRKLSTVIFNIADFCIMIGAMLTTIALYDL